MLLSLGRAPTSNSLLLQANNHARSTRHTPSRSRFRKCSIPCLQRYRTFTMRTLARYSLRPAGSPDSGRRKVQPVSKQLQPLQLDATTLRVTHAQYDKTSSFQTTTTSKKTGNSSDPLPRMNGKLRLVITLAAAASIPPAAFLHGPIFPPSYQVLQQVCYRRGNGPVLLAPEPGSVGNGGTLPGKPLLKSVQRLRKWRQGVWLLRGVGIC